MARHFDGVSNWRVVFANLNTKVQTAFEGGGSVVCMINPASDGGGSLARPVDAANNANAGWFQAVREESSGFVKLMSTFRTTGANGEWKTTNADVRLNSWNTVGTNMNVDNISNVPEMYVNGFLRDRTVVSSASGTFTNASGALHVGNNYSSSVREFDGDIEYVGIWNIELTPAQHLMLSQGADPMTVQRSNLVWYTRLEGNPIENEVNGNSEVGLITGTPTWRPGPLLSKPPNGIQTSFYTLFEEGTATGTKTFTVDTILQKANTKTFTCDVLLQSQQTKTFTVDALLSSQQTKTFTVDTILQSQQTKTFTTDVILQKANTKTFTVDAVLSDPGVSQNTKTFTVDVLLKTVGIAKTFTVDIVLQKTNTKTFTVDAVLSDVVQNTKTFTVDIILQKTNTKTFTVDVVLGDLGGTGAVIVGKHAGVSFSGGKFKKLPRRKRKFQVIINGRIVRTTECNVEGRISRLTGANTLAKITHTISTPIKGKLGVISRGTLESKILHTIKGQMRGQIPEMKALHDLMINNLYEAKLKKIKKMWEEYKKWSK